MALTLLRKRFFVDVLYYIPRSLLLQEFLWECEDVGPQCPRIHRFLGYWHEHIEAKIHTVNICSNDGEYRFSKHLLPL